MTFIDSPESNPNLNYFCTIPFYDFAIVQPS